MYNVTIVMGASKYTNINTGRFFIIVINETLYYGKKLGHSLINPNQLKSCGTMVWDNPFDSNRELFVETEDGNTIYLIENCTKIGFNSIAPTDHELQSLLYVHLTSNFQWNPEAVQPGEVRDNDIRAEYMVCKCKYLGDTVEGDYQYQDPKADE